MVVEFNIIMKKDKGFKDDFVSSWKQWGVAIAEYAKAIKSPPTSVQQALRGQCDNIGTLKVILVGIIRGNLA